MLFSITELWWRKKREVTSLFSCLRTELSVFQDRSSLFSTFDLNSLLTIYKFCICCIRTYLTRTTCLFWILVHYVQKAAVLQDILKFNNCSRPLWLATGFLDAKPTWIIYPYHANSKEQKLIPEAVYSHRRLSNSQLGWAAWQPWGRTGGTWTNSPWPPGYMQRKARPSSSAWTLPAGVSSPPHLSTRRREGEDSRRASRRQTGVHYIRFHIWACRGRGGEEEEIVISALQSVLNTSPTQNPQETNQQVGNSESLVFEGIGQHSQNWKCKPCRANQGVLASLQPFYDMSKDKIWVTNSACMSRGLYR